MPMLRAADLDVHYLEAGDANGTPVLFVHGNWGTASWWVPPSCVAFWHWDTPILLLPHTPILI